MSTLNSATVKQHCQSRHKLDLYWPWWLHPAWALLIFIGGTAATAILLPAQHYALWDVRKYLNSDLSLQLMLGILLMLTGITAASYGRARRGNVSIHVGEYTIRFIHVAYKAFFLLTVFGYGFWVLIALAEGVRIADVISVFHREMGAISDLKASSRPIAGITTLTQFGPVVVAMGVIRKKLGLGGNLYWWIIVLAAIRSTLYAERLALIEVLLPLILIHALTVQNKGGRRVLTQLLPIILGPAVWLVFAIFEYTRSWVYYQNVVAVPFAEWVTSRLLGYYITAYNNSALFYTSHEGVYGAPYMSLAAFWNSPGITSVISKPDWHGMSPENWWHVTLATKGNPEFTNIGSFLVTYAEMGWVAASLFWLLTGFILGALFAALSRGSLPSLIAYGVLFVGLLEVPRLIYWTEGRAAPMVLALILLYVGWPRERSPLTRMSPKKNAAENTSSELSRNA